MVGHTLPITRPSGEDHQSATGGATTQQQHAAGTSRMSGRRAVASSKSSTATTTMTRIHRALDCLGIHGLLVMLFILRV